jgi:aconitase A
MGDGPKEQALVIETPAGLVVITGCAHPGIVQVAAAARVQRGQDIDLLMGGFHLRADAVGRYQRDGTPLLVLAGAEYGRLGGQERRRVRIIARSEHGGASEFQAVVRIDTPQEAEYYRHGGILPCVLRPAGT